MTLNKRHQQCHQEVNSVLGVTGQTLRWNTEQREQYKEKIGSAGGKRSRAGMQASSILIISSISALPALVTSKACSHAAQCLPWIMEAALCPAKSSLLNSLPRYSDTLQPRRDALARRKHGLVGASGDASAQGPDRSTDEGEASLLCATNTTWLWPGSSSVKPNPSFGSAFIGVRCCRSFWNAPLGVIHGTEGVVGSFFSLSISCLFDPSATRDELKCAYFFLRTSHVIFMLLTQVELLEAVLSVTHNQARKHFSYGKITGYSFTQQITSISTLEAFWIYSISKSHQ